MNVKSLSIAILLVVVGIVAFLAFTNNGVEEVSSDISNDIDAVFLVSGQSNTSTVLIDRVVMENPGFIMLREVVNEKAGQVIEASAYLPKGEHINVVIDSGQILPGGGVDISGEFPLSRNTVAIVYADDGDQGFNPFLDKPVYVNGQVLARFVETGAIAQEQVAIPNTQGSSGAPVAATITYTDNGFSPETVEVTRGDTVRFVNESSRPMWVASNEHPAHTILPTFDQFGVSAFGESYEYTFEQEGAWEYHDHVNASETGTIIVRSGN